MNAATVYAQAFLGAPPSYAFPGPVTVETKEVGKVVIRTGKICACDPFLGRQPAFPQPVPRGDFPVFVSIVTQQDDARIAAAIVRFSSTEPERWELAVTAESDVTKLKEDEFYGYPVDSGTAGFLDEAAWA